MATHPLLTAFPNALTLQERHTLLRQATPKPASDRPLATKRLQRWQTQPPFAQPALFQQRLAQVGLTKATFRQTLGWRGDGLWPAGAEPAWATRLQHLWQAGATNGTPSTVSDPQNNPPLSELLTPFAPMIVAARAELQAQLAPLLARYPQIALGTAAQVEALFFATVERNLERILLPTLALEVNVARLQGLLPGATPESRFAAYLAQLQQPAPRQALLLEYPVLFRLAATRLESWLRVSLEVVERLCQDWGAICTNLGPTNPVTALPAAPLGPLVRIEQAQRNTKREGRAVLILTFADGFKLVYKPRSLAMEVHFQQLLAWLNRAGFTPTFRLLTMLDRGDYGWMAWVTAAPCQSHAELGRFYQRQGALLALLYTLEATDLHLNNVIAQGEDPLLIDLEALFHPRDAEPAWPALELAVDRVFYHSVLRPGLLPEPETGDDERALPVDLSGMGGAPGQQTPYAVPTWQGRGTDAMQLTQQPKTLRGSKNMPTLRGEQVAITDFHLVLDQGFTDLYRFLIERRAALLRDDGPLAAFANAEVRVLVRPGQQYSNWLEESLHPNLLRNALDRDRFLDRLWCDVPEHEYLAALIPYEQAALQGGDVPLFTTRADARALFYNNQEIAADFFPRSGLAAAQVRLAALCETDLACQRWFIHATLATVPTRQPALVAYPVTPVSAGGIDCAATLIDEACAIGERLANRAIRADGEATWLGVALLADRYWLVEPLESDLYNGLPGVALFLAQLGHCTGETRWTALAQETMATVTRYLHEATLEADADSLLEEPIGILDGLGGLLYTFAHLATIWADPTWLTVANAQVAQLAEALQPLADQDFADAPTNAGAGSAETADQDEAENEEADEETLWAAVDLARGLGGLLVGLLALHQHAPTAQTLHCATVVGRELWHRLEQLPTTLAAPPALFPLRPFADFFQQRAGLAWPLLTLAQLTGDEGLRTAAGTLVATDPPTTASPGLWLAYLRALPRLGDVARTLTLAQHFATALPTLLQAGLGYNASLGHGDLGYCELLLQAAQTFQAPHYRELAASYAQALVRHSQTDGWRSAVPLAVETPALLTGLAGIGHGLLRVAQPDDLPSLLALEMPRGR